MIVLSNYIERLNATFATHALLAPWRFTMQAKKLILEKMSTLESDYKIFNDVAIHNSVVIDSHAILKGPAIISPNCFVGAHSYIRGGVFLDQNVSLGPGCEVKTSFIFSNSALAHFNFVGDSLVGSHVNLEAGAVIANHFNERKDKTIFVLIDGTVYKTDADKFGAVVGDNTKIGANAVLSPGTILKPDSTVRRLELIEQCGPNNGTQ
jgi:UDP-N-acetylglucosamine diphosphorylase / glucose-1-phosphate thymidylyltransferase / UDP-N-acetylgalactosamine diphosphorylase / glucosamine-1-phosphate N-acetyltransferase / galactosamine-1-phosphate N-acetyltransferase